MIFQSGILGVRKLEEADAEWLAKWLSDPQVLAYYEGRDRPFTREMVMDDFFRRPNDTSHRCLVLYENTPIGYTQFYHPTDEEKETYGCAERSDVFGMDQFIGEPAYWNRGAGTLLVSGMVRYLFEQCGAEQVVMDPQAWNTRALRCYEKCGFQKIKLLPEHEWHEGEWRDCWLIAITRQQWSESPC